MNKTLWKAPGATCNIIEGPEIKQLMGRQCSLNFSLRVERKERFITLLFDGVEAFKCTYMTSLGTISAELVQQTYGVLISIGESPWLNEVHLKYRDLRPAGKRTPKTFQHLRIIFDDGPCYEFICETFRESGA